MKIMEKLMPTFEKYLMPLAEKLGGNRYLNCLRDGMMLAFPLTIFGSLFVVVANLPFLPDSILAPIRAVSGPVIESTLAILTLFITFGIAYNVGKSYKVEAASTGIASLAAFFILTPFVNGSIPLDRLGAKGMFVGMFTAILASEIYRWVVHKNWVIKMPASAPPAVAKSFSALIPMILTLSFFLVLRVAFTFTSFGNVHDFIYTAIQKPLTLLGGGLIATLIAQLIIQMLWFIGLHGQIIINTVMGPIWSTLALENVQAIEQGLPAPNIITMPFIETFTVSLGGTGMTLGVIAAILVFAKSKSLKEVGKLAGPAGIFNVNEPVIFGLPIVMNPIFLIPWVVAPLVCITITYFSMKVGIVPFTTGATVPWTVPIGLSGYLATNSIMGGVIQIVNFFVVMIIWLPFLMVVDKQYSRDENEENIPEEA